MSNFSISPHHQPHPFKSEASKFKTTTPTQPTMRSKNLPVAFSPSELLVWFLLLFLFGVQGALGAEHVVD